MNSGRTYNTPPIREHQNGGPNFKYQTITLSDRKRAKEILSHIQEQCFRKGLGGVKGLCVLFRGMDRDYSKTLTLSEVSQGLISYGIHVKNVDDVEFVFKYFDRDFSGSIDFKEFLLALTPPMRSCRINVIMEAFDKLDHNKDGTLQEDDLMVTYRAHAESHPKYRSGEWTMDKVLKTFLSSFDSAHAPDGKVTREEFLQYYAGVSCTIDDDAYFDLMMRSCWGLPTRKSRHK